MAENPYISYAFAVADGNLWSIKAPNASCRRGCRQALDIKGAKALLEGAGDGEDKGADNRCEGVDGNIKGA